MKVLHIGYLLVASGLLLFPPSARGQSATTGAIAGVVRDTTGAVLPGVTVEAASPVLIEKVRTGVTDGQGQYKIVDLRPGNYVVTFTLPGFATFRRDGLELTTGTTAPVNAEMRVGSIQETVTVTSTSPVVDVQNARTQQVLKGDVLAALPTGNKSPMQIASLTLGAMPAGSGKNDVGGDKGEQSIGVTLHGGREQDGRMNWDGMSTNVSTNDGGGKMRTYWFNTVGVQEVVLDTGGASAEVETGGANLNMVPKDGGNTFSVYGTANYADSRFSSSAIPDAIVARGVTPQPSLKKIWDYGLGIGGPIKKDRLWFYTPHRWWASQSYAVDNYFNKSTNPYQYVPDLSRPAYAESIEVDHGIRLTWQATSKNKLTLEEHAQANCSCALAIGSGARVSPEATIDFPQGDPYLWLTQPSWSYPATNRLLLQAGGSFLRSWTGFLNGVLTSRSAFTGIGTPTPPGPNNFPITELTNGYTWGALPGSVNNNNYEHRSDLSQYNQRVSLSYITGSHAFKAGLQLMQGNNDNYGMEIPNQVNYTFRNGLPSSLTEWAGPFQSLARIGSQGLFAQDQWTLRRMTLNLGVRFDHFTGRALAQDLRAGQFVPARSVAEVPDLPNFKDITPRLGAAFDVFGNGKTSLKGSFGRYLYGQGGGMTQMVAPSLAIVTNVSRTWDDANGNFAPDCTLTNPLANGECGTINNLAFGQPITNITIADDARKGWNAREFSYQTSAQLQHEIRPGFGIAIGYFRTWFRNQTVTQDLAVGPSDFTEFCITAPADAGLGAYSGQPVCGLYNVNPAKFGQSRRVITLAKNFGIPEESFNGVDMGFNTRWGKGALLQGGVTLGRQTIDTCYANGHPELTPKYFPANYPRSPAYCHVTSPWWNGTGSQLKLAGVYPLPWAFQVSGTFKNVPGILDTANLVLTNAQVAPALGRNLSSCPAVGTCTATVTAALLPNGNNGDNLTGSVYDLRLNETDVRITKIARVGKTRLQGMFDIYNVFNNRPPQAIVTTYGAGWPRPSLLLGGRLFKFGAQVDF